ncbi:MAG: hypothetical protein J4N69_10245 [Chloroflexi bacterium]|nr:hypothetical protein [Chloroflexota bacterium]
MHFFKLYVITILFGILGAIGGAVAGGFIAAARCQGGLECLGAAFLGVGLGAILVESCAMALAAHLANQRQGNLPLTFLPTILLAVPIPFALLLGFTAPLAVPLFLLQAWVCVKVQLATGGRKRMGRRARSGSL